MEIIKTFLVPGSVEMTDQLMDHLGVPSALICPFVAVNLNLSQNAATHWASIASVDSVHDILTKKYFFFCVSNLIVKVSNVCVHSL